MAISQYNGLVPQLLGVVERQISVVIPYIYALSRLVYRVGSLSQTNAVIVLTSEHRQHVYIQQLGKYMGDI